MFAIGKEIILYSIAKADSGELIKAVDADKSQPYTCLVCSQPLILRKGTQKRPHFAHKSLSPNCTAETALHYGFKILLHQLIQGYIDRKQPLEIHWRSFFVHRVRGCFGIQQGRIRCRILLPTLCF